MFNFYEVSYSQSSLPSGKKRSFAPATRRRVTNPEMRACKALVFICGRPLPGGASRARRSVRGQDRC